ncbi:MAG: hemolysin family protein [Thermoguttaceae bacterium]
MWLFIACVVGALLISAACSLMEAVLLSLRPGQVAEMSELHPRTAGVWQNLKANIERPIAAILILNTAAHTIGASVAGAQFNHLYGERWIWLFSLGFTFLMLQFTEILPKGAGVLYNQRAALWLARPLSALVRIMSPIEALVRFANRPFLGDSSHAQVITSLEEIAALTGLARMSGEISNEQELIIRRGTRLSASKVRDVMRPRVDIDALDVDTPPDQILGAVAMSGFSRVPVYHGDLDDILGFVYVKDLLMDMHMQRPLDLRRVLRSALVVPETMRLDQLVEMFRQQRTQMAIVLDEHGGTEGLVTLEDVLEEIVGTIHDERRETDFELVSQGPGRWLASGSSSLDHLLEAIGRPELRTAAPGTISTVGGLVQDRLGRVAAPGDQVCWNGLHLEVLQMDGLRIDRLRVTTADTESPPL